MTLKNHSNGLSERAKAFSVESLIKAGGGGGGQVKGNGLQVKTCNNITTELCSSDLWDKFSEIGTEMIVTKAGRRMFPTLKVRFHGLSSTTTYIVYMDIIPVGETRYRYIYHSSQWMPAGSSDVYSGNNLYIHPDSPATGRLWTSQGHISFDKIKLTNNKRPVMAGQISLNSMHKYQPRIHILDVPISDNLILNNASEIIEYIRANTGRTATFTFKQTSFITVTAYQNQDITKLKIQSNPFAKGFREASKPREARINKPTTRQPHLNESALNKSYDPESFPTLTRGKVCPDASLLPDKTCNVPYKYTMPQFDLGESQKCNNHQGNSADIFYRYYR